MKGLAYLVFDVVYYALAVACFVAAYGFVKDRRRRIVACVAVAIVFLTVPATKRVTFQLAQNRFEHLCTTQAGEKIHKVVDGVQGLVVMRPREKMSETPLHQMQRDQFALKDPYSFDSAEVRYIADRYLYAYEFIEFPVRKADVEAGFPAGTYIRMTRFKDGGSVEKRVHASRECSDYFVARYKDPSLTIKPECMLPTFRVRVESIAQPAARYGYTWSEVTTRDDRDKWIGGGTMEVKDLQSGEVLATKTGFLFANFPRHSPDVELWSITDRFPGRECPEEKGDKALSFIQKALRPADALNMADAEVVSPELYLVRKERQKLKELQERKHKAIP